MTLRRGFIPRIIKQIPVKTEDEAEQREGTPADPKLGGALELESRESRIARSHESRARELELELEELFRA